MSILVYNTLSRKKEEFFPLQKGRVGIYACGVTVYDVCHIGHGMQAIIYDVIRNYFEFLGFDVTYVRNYTDVDDKIIERADKLGICPLEHSRKMIQSSLADLALLGVKPADIEPKVSDHIPEIVALIQRLIAKGSAYPAEGDVYFRVESFEDYGRLSNRCLEEMCAGARVEVDPKKENPMDFALWKKAKPGEISWPSPWGEGRPGWHIECSALSTKYLGTQFDIHGGGKDLIFPHHENEIAQSVQAYETPFANYWIHNGLVTVDGRKMSKSFNNFISIRDAVRDYYPETIRYTILCHHYSSNIDFSEKSFYDAYHRLIYFYATLKRVYELAGAMADFPQNLPPGLILPDVEASFHVAMRDDFNTTVAIREIGAGFKFLNDLLAVKKPKLKQKLFALVQMADVLKRCLGVLGLVQEDPAAALAQIQEYLVHGKNIDPAAVETLVVERNQARENKDWAHADQVRDRLSEMGITVMDSPEGTVWQVLP